MAIENSVVAIYQTHTDANAWTSELIPCRASSSMLQ
jgi:hypothetical protein